MNRQYFAGTLILLRLFLRRDRLLLPIWVLLPWLLTSSQVNFVNSLPDWQAFVAELSANPMAVGLLGPVVPASFAGAVIWRSAIQGAMVLILGAMLTVIRHTRSDEEAGRSELLRAGTVGRYAGLMAALLLTWLGSLLAGLLAALTLTGSGLPASGSLIFGLTMAAAGWFSAGVGALAAQLREHAGAARGIAWAVAGAGFLLFVWNNVGGGYTGWAWLAPMAWHRLTQPFDGNYGGFVLVLAVLSALLAVVGFVLLERRDFGAGLLRPSSGPAYVDLGLRSPLALAWRLHKGSLIRWLVGMAFVAFGIGASIPSVAENVSGLLPGGASRNWIESMGGSRQAFLSVAIYISAALVGGSVYAISTVLGLREEETEKRLDTLITRPVSRMQWMGSQLFLVFSGSALLLLVLGLSAGLGWGLTTGEVSRVLPLALGMSLSKIPAVWVIAGIAAILYGLLPRAATLLSWGFLILFIAIEMAWEAKLVDWQVMQLTPLGHVHYTIPVSQVSIFALIGLTVATIVLTSAGIMAFQRRDLRL